MLSNNHTHLLHSVVTLLDLVTSDPALDEPMFKKLVAAREAILDAQHMNQVQLYRQHAGALDDAQFEVFTTALAADPEAWTEAYKDQPDYRQQDLQDMLTPAPPATMSRQERNELVKRLIAEHRDGQL